MIIENILTIDRVVCSPDINSKKKVLELLSATLSDQYQTLSAQDIFQCLLSREQLGATALGDGVALPHGRCDSLDDVSLAVVKLSKGINFDAPDGQMVDLFLGLIVPEDSNSQHLEILSLLAEMLADKTLVTKLRDTNSSEVLYNHLVSWKSSGTSTDEA